MIKLLIKRCIDYRIFVLIFCGLATLWALQSLPKLKLDALPDLSDVQVIVRTSYPGQSPQVVEDQITYPLTSTLLAVPKAKTVRGFSFFGDSYVYIIFEEGTDLYWTRSRVLEYLNQSASRLPADVQPSLGPDASGVGWVYQYALIDRTGSHDLSDLTSLQNWFLKYELQALKGVAEVATVGGMVREYQVVISPQQLQAFNLSFSELRQALLSANGEVGGSVIEMAEAEYMVRSRAYIKSIDDIKNIPLPRLSKQAAPLLLGDIAEVRLGPQSRRGVADLNGEGEVVGGIVVMRVGENAQLVISAVEKKLQQLRAQLPEGVEIIEVYNRANLIERAVQNLNKKLLLELLIVSVVTALFLLHLRSALVAVISLPLGIVLALAIMRYLDISANIMSLGGIAIAIGAMVDAAIVMVENQHKHLEQFHQKQKRYAVGAEHWRLTLKACQEVAPALFISLMIITLSFLPVFALEAQEGKLFSPLAWTKTLSMAVASLLSVTLVPVLMGYWVRGGIKKETANPLSRFLTSCYRPLIHAVLKRPLLTLLLMLLLMVSSFYPFDKTGSEFMPDINEGDLLYMPTTLPGISIDQARALVQQTDRLIKSVPEVKRVFGKIGRAETATDPAPLTMIETSIQFHDLSQWRAGMTMEQLIAELNAVVNVPGITNAWVQPIRTRIDMLSTGIKTPLGLRVSGDDLVDIEKAGLQIESALQGLPKSRSVYAERVLAGRYINIDPKREVAGRYGLTVDMINQMVAGAVGGAKVLGTTEGRESYPLTLRYPQQQRNSVEALKELVIVTPNGAQVTLGQIADIEISSGPPVIKSENARLSAWVLIDVEKSADLSAYIEAANQRLLELDLPVSVSLSWTGQYEYLQRAEKKMRTIVPLTLLLIVALLYLLFRRFSDVLLVMAMLPFALSGGLWLVWLMGFQFSVAVVVGFIALAGLAAEFGVVMLLYLHQQLQSVEPQERGGRPSEHAVDQALINGALLRVRPKAMTVCVIIAGLLPILLSTGTGSEVMQRIAAPMVGGMVTAPLASMLLMPALLKLLYKRGLIKVGA